MKKMQVNHSSTINDEVLVVIHDSSIAAKWDAEFQQMWNDTKSQHGLFW